MTRMRAVVASTVLLALAGFSLQAQSAASAPAVAANATGISGQGRGITAVTRRTLMGGPGQGANAFFAAGGVNLGAAPGAVVPVPAPAAS